MEVYYDKDADLSVLHGRKVAILGYGNQGRAQALNMRDSGVEVIVGNISDASFERARADGFPTMSVGEAAAAGDILCLLVPDEVQRSIYDQDIAPHLRPGQTLDFAHGYNIAYGHIKPRADLDVIMVAPRMIGVGVRSRFEAGTGAPVYAAVQQDATGHAWPTALAVAKAIGATRVGAFRTTFAEETFLDLFCEQAVWPAILRVLRESFEMLVDRGYQPEAVLMELYASGESGEIFKEMADVGMFRQMSFHSHTSQFGTLTRGPRVFPNSFRQMLEMTIREVEDGAFAKEWEADERAGYPIFDRLKAAALAHPINEIEDRLHASLHGPSDSATRS
jgi:ketol-acid reductoisomerase